MLYKDLAFIILELLLVVGLYLLAGYAAKALSPKWRLCYAVPLIVCLFVIAGSGFEKSMLPAYLGTAVLLSGYIKDSVKIRKTACGICGAALLLSVVICNVYKGYRAPDYVQDFKNGFAEMKTHYALTEHKGIDWDVLYERYLPQFEEADKNHDEIADCLAWNAFAMEFHDGHVAYSPNNENVEKQASEQICGNDYGLSLMTLTNGQTVAVNVEKDSTIAKAGIHNGTVITAWDGMPIEKAAAQSKETAAKLQNYASKENEAFYSTLAVAGAGGERVTICYVDDSGVEQTITADRIGTYADRWKESMEILNKGVEISNLEWENIDDKTALMRMRFMSYDAKENFSEMEKEIREKLLALKEAGVTNLIFDLRSNGGGSGSYVEHIIKLIAPEGEHVYACDGVFDVGNLQYKKGAKSGIWEVGECETYQGEALWSHGNIIILVNAQTVSAGDHFTQLASAFPNVTVMGLTHSNCSAQGISSVQFDYGYLSYSAVLLLKEDGTVFVDTDYNRESTVPLDIQIPFDEKAVKMMFDDGEDYVLWYAMEYLGR